MTIFFFPTACTESTKVTTGTPAVDIRPYELVSPDLCRGTCCASRYATTAPLPSIPRLEPGPAAVKRSSMGAAPQRLGQVESQCGARPGATVRLQSQCWTRLWITGANRRHLRRVRRLRPTQVNGQGRSHRSSKGLPIVNKVVAGKRTGVKAGQTPRGRSRSWFSARQGQRLKRRSCQRSCLPAAPRRSISGIAKVA